LKGPLPEVDPDAAVEDVMGRLPTAVADARAVGRRPAASRWSVLGLGLAAALAVGFLVASPRLLRGPGEGSSAFQARGAPIDSIARAVGVRLVRASGSGGPLAPETHVRPDDAYAVRYDNLSSRPVYLLAFAVDATEAVHWICPAYLEPGTNPSATAIAPSTIDARLPSAVQLEGPAPGRMRFVAILSPSPLHVLDVDNLRGAELSTASLQARWPTADVRELVTVHVDSAL
jgi:hypothetical protein